MSQSNNQTPIIPNTKNSEINKKILSGSRKNMPFSGGKDFIIKQKNINTALMKRQKTN